MPRGPSLLIPCSQALLPVPSFLALLSPFLAVFSHVRGGAPLQSTHRWHDLLGKPAHAGQDVAVWHQAARVEPADELSHLALGVCLLNFAYAGRRRAVERRRLYLFPSGGIHPLADLPQIGIRRGVVAFAQACLV